MKEEAPGSNHLILFGVLHVEPEKFLYLISFRLIFSVRPNKVLAAFHRFDDGNKQKEVTRAFFFFFFLRCIFAEVNVTCLLSKL